MPRRQDFDPSVPLPPGLDIVAIQKAIQYVERRLKDWIEVYYEQANLFSALVSVIGSKALDAVSNYEKHRNIDTAQQRFPDLKRRGSGQHPTPGESLESKGSKCPWAVQAHYDHPGWYIVWRYLVDPTESLEAGKPILIWRVDVVFLEKADWKYEKSSAGESGGGRTHTYGLKKAAKKLTGKAVYARKDIRIKGGKPVPKNGDVEVAATR